MAFIKKEKNENTFFPRFGCVWLFSMDLKKRMSAQEGGWSFTFILRFFWFPMGNYHENKLKAFGGRWVVSSPRKKSLPSSHVFSKKSFDRPLKNARGRTFRALRGSTPILENVRIRHTLRSAHINPPVPTLK
jgi:hypothetical protein